MLFLIFLNPNPKIPNVIRNLNIIESQKKKEFDLCESADDVWCGIACVRLNASVLIRHLRTVSRHHNIYTGVISKTNLTIIKNCNCKILKASYTKARKEENLQSVN